MSIRSTAFAALLVLFLCLFPAPPVRGREVPAPGGTGDPGEAAASALETKLPRRCGVCHLDKAPAGALGRIVFKPPGVQVGAGDAAICYSCHNGIVSDDRRALWSGRHHPASGDVTCGSCHTPHVRDAKVRPFMRYRPGNYAYCTTCHRGRRAGDPGEHPAVPAQEGRAQDCGGCHVVHRAQGDGLIRVASAESLCGPCHGENPSRDGKGPGMTTHVTGKNGPPCLGCHTVHKTAGGKKLLDKAALDGRLCRTCHERNFSAGKSEANHPVAPDQATCLSCHRMHNAENAGKRPGLLGAPWSEADSGCRRCHADVAGAGESEGEAWNHSLDMSAAGEERPLVGRLAEAGAVFAPGGRITCLTCHRAHAGRVGTPQLVAARQALCLYCHPAQNSLNPESAALGAHPISVKPRRARVDASFIEAGGRTGPGGEITCVTCHRAHRGRPGTPGLVIPRESYSCLLCHAQEASIASTPHGSASSPESAGSAAFGGLCGGCHGEHGWRVPLAAATEGKTAIERLCAACHGAGAAGAPLAWATNHPMGVTLPPGRGTAGLPLFWNDGRRYRQGVITCASCHDVHRAGPGGLFLRESFASRSRDLCFGCHVAEAAVSDSPHDLAKSEGTTCGPCHRVHDALAVSSWPAARGGGDRAAADLADYCGGCHSSGGRASGFVIAERFHPAVPAFGVKAGSGVGCVGCHDPHRWNSADTSDGSGSPTAGAGDKFLVRSAVGPAALCVGCHAGQAAVTGTPHDLTEPGAGAGVCASCHRAHGAQPLSGVPVQPIQRGQKAAPGSDPCETCHAEGNLASNATVGERGHPVGVSPGQDVGPDLPLFGLTGRRQPGGRIACATCHDPHRWAPAGGSGAAVAAATSFLRMGADGYAPLCFPCHAEKSMVVGTDHDLRVTAPTAVNNEGITAQESGVCGACHAMHRSQEARVLWNRGFGEGRDEGSRACTGCHRAGNDLGAHVPPRAEAHLVNFPGRGLVSRLFTIATSVASGPDGIPVYADDGSRSDRGYLSCVSCHDAHRWEADVTNSGSGMPVEGDVSNSFLRVRGTALDRTMCAECHGGSLIENYNNYHFPEGK